MSFCGTCRWCGSMVGNDKSILTICRRFPPTVVGHAIQVAPGHFQVMENTIWPQVNPNLHTCGEHLAKPAALVA